MIARTGPAIGESFGGYTIESVVGRGGMGTVYLATHEHLARKAALKVITDAHAHDAEFRTRFLDESRLAASLDHPNVIPIYDAGEIEGVLYLAMRYVSGDSLHSLLRTQGVLPIARALAVVDQVGGALDAAHRAGLVHRDVKPANVLLAREDDQAYLCDFGLATRTHAKGITRAGSFYGTVDYAAPEQIQGRRVNGRADIYALGCVLFECLSGSPPYVRENEFLVLQAHIADPPPSLSDARDDLPRSLDAVVATVLAKDPQDRYATGGAFAAALRDSVWASGSALAGDATRPAPMPRTGEPPPPGRSARPRTRIVLALVASALALAAATIVVLTRTHGGGAGGTDSSALPVFVDRVENVLQQSAGGRREVADTLASGLACSIPPREAGRRIASAADNRQSILEQVAATEAPTPRTAAVVTLLQRALQESIEADRHYRDAFRDTAGCPLAPSRALALAKAADTRATAAKERFAAAFDPLARRFDRRTWLASEF